MYRCGCGCSGCMAGVCVFQRTDGPVLRRTVCGFRRNGVHVSGSGLRNRTQYFELCCAVCIFVSAETAGNCFYHVSFSECGDVSDSGVLPGGPKLYLGNGDSGKLYCGRRSSGGHTVRLGTRILFGKEEKENFLIK